jgi:hypothetical protein
VAERDDVVITVTNNASQPVYLPICGPWHLYRQVQEGWEVAWEIDCEIDYLGHKIEPGQAFSDTFSLRDHYWIAEPGLYKIEVEVYSDCILGAPEVISPWETYYGEFEDCATREVVSCTFDVLAPATARDIILWVISKGGFTPPMYQFTKGPEFVLYGDGRAVFAVYDKSTQQTTMMEARLSEEEVQELLAFIERNGFWDLEDGYFDAAVTDLPTTAFWVEVDGRRKEVQVYALYFAVEEGLAPRGLKEIHEHLANFSHPSAREYQPQEVSLFAEEVTWEVGDAPPWPVEGISLADVAATPPVEVDWWLTMGYVVRGEVAREVVSVLRDCCLYSGPVFDVDEGLFSQDGIVYSVGYRPHLPHEE